MTLERGRASAFPPPPASDGAPRPAPSADGAGSRNRPRNRVERCQTFAVGSSTGSASWCSSVQSGCSAAKTASTTIACSWRSLADDPSASAFARSSSGSPARGAEPASGFARTSDPCRDTNNSGDAPTRMLPVPVGAANAKQSGSTARRRCTRRRGSSARPASTSMVRARTTLSSPPSRSRSSAASTALAYDSRGGTAVTCISANAACGAESPLSRSNDIGAEPSPLPTRVSRVMSSVPRRTTWAGTVRSPSRVAPNGNAPTAIGGEPPSLLAEANVFRTAASARPTRSSPAGTSIRANVPRPATPCPARSKKNPSGGS